MLALVTGRAPCLAWYNRVRLLNMEMVKEHRIQVGPVVKGKTYPVSELVKILPYILTPSQNMYCNNTLLHTCPYSKHVKA